MMKTNINTVCLMEFIEIIEGIRLHEILKSMRNLAHCKRTICLYAQTFIFISKLYKVTAYKHLTTLLSIYPINSKQI